MARIGGKGMSHFEYHLNKKIESGHLYHTAFQTGNKVCDKCPFRNPWDNKCRKFNASIKKINQSNGGFHHEPCKECLEYKIQQSDIDYIRKRYESRR